MFSLLTFLLTFPSVGAFASQQGHLWGTSFGLPGTNASYDYVIIGGGTAGLTLATRLAQNSTLSVAVVEAGSFYELDNGNLSQIPAFDYYSAGVTSLEGVNPLIDWRFLTTAQPAFGNHVLHYARGKCLGGSSARNYMIYNRGTVGTFTKWADDVGDSSYEWENVFPYYQKSVHFTPANVALRGMNATPVNEAGSYTPYGGPLQVSYPNFAAPWSVYFDAAVAELGIEPLPHGPNQGQLIGASWVPTTIDPKQETRSSSESSFLALALEQTALTVYTHTLAKRILFDDQKTARGVLLNAAGVDFVLNASKELIVSSGAFQSPQILMVSGIGPAATLQEHGIPVIVDRPGVGQNLWDNPIITASFEVDIETTSVLSNDPARIYLETEKYLENKTGLLTAPGGDVFVFDKVTDKTWANISNQTRSSFGEAFPSDWPELELISFATGPVDGVHNYASIAGGILATFSRGNVTISSTDTADAPVINPNLLEDPRDQELAVAFVRYARRLSNTTAIQSVISGAGEVLPGPAVQTDDQILAYILNTTTTLFHAAGTNKMGRRNDSMAVVDSDAKVIGVQGLRVVDISVFPLLPPGQPQSAVYMLAEKIADRILAEA